MADNGPSDETTKGAEPVGVDVPVAAPRSVLPPRPPAPPRPLPPPPPSARNRPPPAPSSLLRRPLPPPPPRPSTASPPPLQRDGVSVRPAAPSFPPGDELARTLSGIGPITPEPPLARDDEPLSGRFAELLRKLSEHEERSRVLLAEREALRAERRALSASGDELREKLGRTEDAARSALSEREHLLQKLAESRAEAARHEATAREQAELRVRLGEEHATTVAALTRRVAGLEDELAERGGLEARLVELEQKAERFAELGLRHDEVERALGAANERIRELEAGQVRPVSGDDLTRVRGIGPTFDRALRAAGVTRLAQIAAWTDDEIPNIAAALRARPERIRREDWIGSARRLLEEV